MAKFSPTFSPYSSGLSANMLRAESACSIFLHSRKYRTAPWILVAYLCQRQAYATKIHGFLRRRIIFLKRLYRQFFIFTSFHAVNRLARALDRCDAGNIVEDRRRADRTHVILAVLTRGRIDNKGDLAFFDQGHQVQPFTLPLVVTSDFLHINAVAA